MRDSSPERGRGGLHHFRPSPGRQDGGHGRLRGKKNFIKDFCHRDHREHRVIWVESFSGKRQRFDETPKDKFGNSVSRFSQEKNLCGLCVLCGKEKKRLYSVGS